MTLNGKMTPALPLNPLLHQCWHSRPPSLVASSIENRVLKMCVHVYISQNPSTSSSYPSRLQQPPNGVIYVQQCKTTLSSRTVGQSDMDKDVSPIPAHFFGTHFHEAQKTVPAYICVLLWILAYHCVVITCSVFAIEKSHRTCVPWCQGSGLGLGL